MQFKIALVIVTDKQKIDPGRVVKRCHRLFESLNHFELVGFAGLLVVTESNDPRHILQPTIAEGGDNLTGQHGIAVDHLGAIARMLRLVQQIGNMPATITSPLIEDLDNHRRQFASTRLARATRMRAISANTSCSVFSLRCTERTS